jgi:hypothetical protein
MNPLTRPYSKALPNQTGNGLTRIEVKVNGETIPLNHDAIKAINDKKTLRMVCLDEAFTCNDQSKTNAVQTMNSRGVTILRTVQR